MVHQNSKLCIEKKIQFCWAKMMKTGVTIKIIENQSLVFISNMASTVVLSHGKWEVALSSCEAEYQGIAAAAQEVSFLRQLLLDLQHPQQQPTSVGEDYHSAIKLSTNPVFHKRSKHIDVKQNFLEMQCKKMKLTSYMCQPKKWQPIFSLKDFVEPNSPSIVRILWAD